MNENTRIIASALSDTGVKVFDRDYMKKGFHTKIVVETPEQIRPVVKILYQMKYFMGFVTACHTAPAIQVLYQFARYDINHRIMIQCSAGENNAVPSIWDIFHGADWHERETHDFFGVSFTGHPNMAPLILDETDKDLKPLLKSENILKTVDEIFVQEAANE